MRTCLKPMFACVLSLLGLCSCASTGAQPEAAASLPPKAQDRWSRPFKRMVILGESTVQGGRWLERTEDRYADVLAQLINDAQGEPMEYINKGIGANSISPRSPGYEKSIKPSAMERYEQDVIANKPDLFIMAYGLNDMRAGMGVKAFIEEEEKIVRAVQEKGHPLVVLVSVYHMPHYNWFPPFDKGSAEATVRYNTAIRDLAERTGCLYADVYSAQGRADWLVHQDSVHAHKVGNLVIAHKIFEVLANHCSGLSQAVNARNESSEWTRKTRDVQKATIQPVK
jgi:lysophospholipase L1-like esterase